MKSVKSLLAELSATLLRRRANSGREPAATVQVKPPNSPAPPVKTRQIAAHRPKAPSRGASNM